MGLTAADILARKKPISQTVKLVLDSELADEWAVASSALESAKGRQAALGTAEARKAVMQAEDELERLQPLVEDNTVDLKMEAVGRSGFQALVELHAPTPEQIAKAERENEKIPEWNSDTFPAALVSACLVDPKMTEDEVQEMFDSEKFNTIEVMSIFGVALLVNTSNKVVDLGKG